MNEEQRERLLEIERRDGWLTAKAVVEDAKDPDSPLHCEFDWDVERSAQRWWEHKARTLIQAVRVEQARERVNVSSVRYTGPMFVRDPDLPGDRQGYLSVESVRDDKDKAHRVLVAEFKRIAALLERARDLADLLGRRDDMVELIDTFGVVRERFEAPEARQ